MNVWNDDAIDVSTEAMGIKAIRYNVLPRSDDDAIRGV